MKIAVTGCAGFLGSHLVDALLEGQHRVVGIDNLSMGRMENIEHQLGNPRFAFYPEDVRRRMALRGYCKGAEVIVHLAAFKIPRYGKSIDTLLINSQGTHSVLEVAREIGAKVILASTSDVYGKNAALPFHEESDSVFGSSKVARWGYAVSKLFDEHLAFAYQEEYGIPVVVLRIFGSYGPRHHLSWWGGPQAVFISQILKGEPVTIHGDGMQTRTFAYVSDIVDGMLQAILRDQANGEIFNLGGQEEIAIIELARLIHRLCGVGRSLAVNFVPYSSFNGRPYEDVMRRVPDVSRAEKMLGYRPKVALEEGLRRTIAWQREVLHLPAASLSVPARLMRGLNAIA
ncbi:MAG: GDP-mannose 4,6-dehydratase [bacterium]|jgi:UDP-glucose 4-epimerase|nr:GDP-mannose 4,6-dehydratase [candidate division KSB1 bacterium]MDH7559519.1 GDP-mannose 4,6-dehydratase [bacterium]